jgi:hypothetical protein
MRKMLPSGGQWFDSREPGDEILADASVGKYELFFYLTEYAGKRHTVEGVFKLCAFMVKFNQREISLKIIAGMKNRVRSF